MTRNRMLGGVLAAALLGAGIVAAQAPAAPPAAAGKMIEYSNEARFQLDLKVADAALAAYLPAGWTPNVAPQGAAKDCNLRAIFIDRVTINGGVRWEPFFGQQVEVGGVTNFDIDKFKQGVKSQVFVNAPAGIVYPSDPGFPPGRSGFL